MAQVNFRSVRPIRGSSNNGFEELCCQLGEAEPAPADSRFIRNGTPDGGVEGYRIFGNALEHGWQAKYFFELGQSQWQQLDESVKTALKTHPNLRRYTICLPIDLPDARLEEQKSLRQRWDLRVEKWTALASERGMSVAFDLWGEYELLTRLSLEVHAGRRWFWFNETELSQAWFGRHLGEAIEGAGPRYNNEFSVDLPVAIKFEALGYTPGFRAELRTRQDKWRERSKQFVVHLDRVEDANFAPARDALMEADRALARAFGHFRDEAPGPTQYEEFERSLEEAVRAAYQLSRILQAAEVPAHPDGPEEGRRVRHPFESELSNLRVYRSATEDLRELLVSASGELMGRPAMLLSGEAGSGKTHLLCDVAKHRIEAGLPTLVLLGQQLGRGEVWRQIMEPLGLDCTRDELLGALESAAQAAAGRALIFIDAINEAPEIDWQNALPPLLEVLSRFPRIGIAVSCRSTYELYLVREDLVPRRLTRVEHRGFGTRLFEAIAAFCRHYDLETLNTPPLDPEFANPLFLKLFCQGLHERGMRRPPKGHHGLQRIFAFLIDSVNEKLHRPEVLDYHPSDRIVHRAVDAIADAMVESRGYSVPRAAAEAILRAIHPGSGPRYSQSLLRRLIAEGILADDLRYTRDREEPKPVIRFGYERLADFQIARRLLDRHLHAKEPEAAFREGGFFGELFGERSGRERLRGLLSALIVLVPERLGREIDELMPSIAERYYFRESFLEALPWREGRHLTEHAIRYVERLLDEGDHGSSYHTVSDEALDRILQLAGLPDHPLNARWLHSRLLGLPMSERDYRWSTYLHRSRSRGDSDSPSVIERLLDWAWPGDSGDADPFAGLDDEVVELAATAIAWCLTTPNRFIRDRATKALACLVTSRARMIPGLLEAFNGVDDPYVAERLYGAVLGATVRLGTVEDVRPIAQAAYDHIFASGSPPPHLLLRDFARGIIEYAASLRCAFAFDLAEVRPPYRSEPPPVAGISWEELQERYKGREFTGLVHSLWPDHGDFARYVMGSDSRGLHTWVTTPDPYAEVRSLAEERVELPQPLAAEWWRVKRSRLIVRLDLSANAKGPSPAEEADLPGDADDDYIIDLPGSDENDTDEETSRFLRSLSAEDRDLVELYEAAEARHREALEEVRKAVSEHHADGEFPCCWVMTRVMELGWTPERFAEFDQWVNRNDAREAKKPERIGKKYQWIAYHELAARVTDHRPFQHEYYSESFKYEGPWQRSFRDIDPTFLAKVPTSEGAARAWWSPIPSSLPALPGLSDRDWLLDGASVPDLSGLIMVVKPGDSRRWFTLHRNHFESGDLGQAAEGSALARRLTFTLGSFIVRKTDVARFVADVTEGDWTGLDVSCPDFDNEFLGEFAWAQCFENLRNDARAELTDLVGNDSIQRRRFKKGGPNAARPALRYVSSFGFDCSLPYSSHGYGGYTPSVWLATRMGLSWGRRRFRFVDRRGRLVALDPAHEEPGPGAFLIDQATLLEFLEENDLSIVWLIIGEKMLTGDRDAWTDDRSEPRIAVFRQVYELGSGLDAPVLRTIGPLGSAGTSY